MTRVSNTLIGFLNLLTLLASVLIIGGGLWMAKSTATCENFLQRPFMVVGFIILLLLLAGFIGACFLVVWALWVYLVVMLFFITALLAVSVFRFVVVGTGGVIQVPGRNYKEYLPTIIGCCKPPTAYDYQEPMITQDLDCYRWNCCDTHAKLEC